MKKIYFSLFALLALGAYSFGQSCCNVIDTYGVPVEDKNAICIIHGSGDGLGACDSDGDGIPDDKDNCPKIKGVAANGGCPEVRKEVKEAIKAVVESLDFETDSDVIKNSSYNKLDVLAGILNQHETLKVKISGHTDNTGDAKYNLDLSQRRADAAKAYLVTKGVSADRLGAYGYGQESPVASNDTPEGRKQNRRVDFKIVFKEFMR